ncbi:MAG: protein phosphatase 2C domain-containing protein, partial [Paramuribaculum sp.]|nr:protein phosphatase 2C domain-containing protein [Paramuribaculum sp.]
MITIRQPLSFSETGRKPTQEDSLFPPQPHTGDRIFILCDGMGGHNRGDIASSTVATTLGESLTGLFDNRQPINQSRFNRALTKAYDALELIPDAGSEPRPGTTLAALVINSRSALAAHIGDSRIYHIRPSLFDPQKKTSGILYRSDDHSIVGELIRSGQLTDDEARIHPRRNIITRAIQPRLQTRFEPTFRQITDIRSGDYFFLCTDGVLEQLTDSALAEILADGAMSDKEKIDAIKQICNRGTRDNFTAWLIPISAVEIPQRKKRITRGQLIGLAFLTAVIIMGIIGIASYYLYPNQSPDGAIPVNADTIPVPAATTTVDTIPLHNQAEPADSATASQPAQPAAPSVSADSMTHPQKTPDDTLRKQPATGQPQPTTQPETPQQPDSATGPAAADPPIHDNPRKTKPGEIPARKKDKPSAPQPLA